MTQQTAADNNIETTYSYDWLGCPTLVTEASSTASARETQTSYEDRNRRVVVKKDQSAKGDGLLVQVTDYDPLRRVQLSRQLTNPGAQSPDDDTAGIKVQKRYVYGT